MDTILPPTPTLGDASFSHPRFAAVELLGEGSMGCVYRAHDQLRDHPVAIKTIPASSADEIYWLKSEFRSLADVRHRNLVELHELIVEDERCFFTMELIDGVDIVHFVERAVGPDRALVAGSAQVAVLYDCIAQLVHAIRTVHQAGKLHRDIKPSNVLVTREGRVVLLDFGLTMAVRRRPARAGQAAISGTPLYMSPEQASGMALSSKADWYSLGILLYQALTGAAPFSGSFAEMLLRKRRRPPDPRDRCGAVPAPLAALVVALLEPEPGDRPDGQAILECLGGDAVHERRDGDQGWFVGRSHELRELNRGLERSRSGPVVVHVRGESGMGKSALLQRWCDRVETDERAVVLRSRCHPRESLPFKALDGAIDGLTQHLRSAAPRELPRDDGAALIRIFPVLARAPGFGTVADGASPSQDPFEARRSGASALKQTLHALSRHQPIVLWIDDVQWGDVDSAWILRTILQPPDPPALLLVLSYRSDAAAGSELLSTLARSPIDAGDVARVDLLLGPLPEAESEALARLLLDDTSRPDASRGIARDAAGSPFFIRELALHQPALDRDHPAVPLERVLAERLEELDEPSCRILDVVALATSALDVAIALEAAGLGPDAHGAVTRLQSRGFVRLSPYGDRQLVQPYHDRIREAVLGRLGPEAIQLRHRGLAKALGTKSDTDPEALFHHSLGAQDVRSAAHHAEVAAERAAAALAFDRAASLYAAALELGPAEQDRPDLVIRLAEALENNGRTADAAQRYLQAASSADERAVGEDERLALRRRAAECFMKSGHLGEGRRQLWRVLQAVGVAPPRDQRDAIRKTMLLRLPLLLRRIDARSLSGRSVTPPARASLAALWAATSSLVMTEQHTAAYVGVHFIRAALASGHPSDVARAVLHEAACEGALRFSYFRRRASQLLATMERASEYLDDPYVSSYVLSVRASNEWEMGRWRNVVELLDRSMAIIKSGCQGISWEIGVALNFSFNALSYLGRMRDLAPRLEAELQAAKDRGDVLAMNHFRLGQSSFARLATDEVDYALALADEARASMDPDQFDIPHYHHLILVTQCHLYRGDAAQAWRCIDEAWPRLRAAQFLQIAFPRVELLHLRARCALALLADRAHPAASASNRIPAPAALRRLVRGCAAQVRRSDAVPAAPMAAALLAGLAALERDEATACRQLERAAEGFRASEMALHQDAALLQLGRRLGGDHGEVLRARAQQRLALQVRNPERVVATIAPGLLA